MPSRTDRPTSELQLADALEARIRDLWSSPTAIREFASPGGGRCDISVLSCGRLYSIEVKVRDWRKAIAQAVLNRYWADRCYIALWHSDITERVENEARGFGLGVIEVLEAGSRVRVGARQGKPSRGLKTQALAEFGRYGRS